MSALTADRNTPYLDGYDINVKLAAATTIFAGSIVVANASGYAVPGTAASGLAVLGRASGHLTNSGAAGDASLVVMRNKAFQFANSGSDAVVQADVGRTCYIEDDQTVCHTATGKSAAGKVLAVESDGVWVFIS